MQSSFTHNHTDSYIIIADERYRIVGEDDELESKCRNYLQSIFLPSSLLYKFIQGTIKLDVALQHPTPLTPDSIWTAWGIGKFFPRFTDQILKAFGICLEPCDGELPSVPSNRDLRPLVDFLLEGKNGYCTPRMQIVAKAKKSALRNNL